MMAVMVKSGLTAICTLTLLATAYLSLSLLILRPPHANYQRWAIMATVIVAQSVLTLVALFARTPRGLQYAVLASGFGIACIGALSIYSMLANPHFEGYVLVLGSMLVVQGALTLAVFARQRPMAIF
jgi:hypothetical protein